MSAGVALDGSLVAALAAPAVPVYAAPGIILGLVFGTQAGVMLGTWLAVGTGLASLPRDVSWRQICGASWLTRIGFTVSLLIAGLAFGEDPALLSNAKLGTLIASVIAGTGGWLILRR